MTRTKFNSQWTISEKVSISGHGLHTGHLATVTLHPAPSGHGVVFLRSDLGVLIPASHNHVDMESSTLSTVLTDRGVSVRTVEHGLSAIVGMGLSNVLVEVSGPEIPIADGSAWPFAKAILNVGLKEQSGPSKMFRVARPVEYRDGGKLFRARPSGAFAIDYSVDFGPAFRQRRTVLVTPTTYLNEVSMAKTFCLESDLEKIRAAGLAKGGTRENALIVGSEKILNARVQTYKDELVRHKILDFLGDMALAGGGILGNFSVVRGGHRFHVECLWQMIRDNVLEPVSQEIGIARAG